jgi:FMN phosphatase YigB (HAD superfamily)
LRVFAAVGAVIERGEDHRGVWARLGVERPPERIAYVGDRLDNDVLPARRAGMLAIFIRRGRRGHIQATRPEVAQADARVEPLAEIPGVLAKARES